ncbi:MAG: Por secretion system protein, partial [Bacteroidales bacterium]|nr:Por secretion system protein [Bacteroidales bacterium]
MVTTDPAVPVMGKVIKIYYDTSKDPGELNNFTGDIYVHTGLILEGSSLWQKVIGTWANNSTQPKLNYLGNYRYELVISPDIQTFYNVLPGEKVKKIALVFRNSTGSKQTRPDIFIDVFEQGLNVIFTLPEKYSLIAEPSEELRISASATNADSVSLYLNGKYIKGGKTPELLTDTVTLNEYGGYWFRAMAWDLPASAADSFFVYVRRPLTVEDVPAGMKDGINYNGDNSVTLVLHAPYKEYVFAVGDFNDWLACEEGYMKTTPDRERYWLEIDNLEPGREYRFQYRVDTGLFIADPYADKVLDEFNDEYITSSTYPGLIEYPKGKTTGMVSVLQTARQPYNWITSGFQPPEKEKLVIYELLVRDFVAAHDFKTLTDTLNYLKRLGVNAIELMPVTEFEGNLSWGYNVSFYFAPDKYYGPGNSLKAFVDSCHSKGIAVIMDLVLNHCFGQSPFVQLYLDYYATDQIVMKTPNPWFNSVSPNTLYKWGADFNHESPDTKALVDRITSYWLTEYRIDGFRFDFTKGFTN